VVLLRNKALFKLFDKRLGKVRDVNPDV